MTFARRGRTFQDRAIQFVLRSAAGGGPPIFSRSIRGYQTLGGTSPDPSIGQRTVLLRLEFCKLPLKLDNSATQAGSNWRLWNTQLQLLTNLKFVALSLDIGPFCRRGPRCYTAFIRFAACSRRPTGGRGSVGTVTRFVRGSPPRESPTSAGFDPRGARVGCGVGRLRL